MKHSLGHKHQLTSFSLGRLGDLEVVLATTREQRKELQKLRYSIFYKEMSARPSLRTKLLRRDFDRFDKICDHLLVYDHAHHDGSKIVGTYRVLREKVANQHKGFYSEDEFALKPMLDKHKDLNFLELGRSCVLPAYRNKRTIELLWAGIWSYVRQHDIDAMFGCASFPGKNVEDWKEPLSFLYHHARASNDWYAEARPELFIDMNMIAKDKLDTKKALRALPPLIKGYLKLGAKFGTGAIIDHQFGTTDVMVILPVKNIEARYIDYYGAEGERHQAA